ncbi:MAG: radical SAM family heme chaperone HemW [Actinomycetota bacterium]|nr:radical SAM family heme chaperone HemW [Actinomycetota bacterium]
MDFGVYVHVPFCRHRCDYCAFATWTDRDHLADRYLAACRRQIELALPDLPTVTSGFVGGGTPSRVPADGLMDVLAAVPFAGGAEVTVECNPDDVTPELLETYRTGGVTRLSLGVQSMVPSVLATLGRTHDPGNVRKAVDAANGVGLPFNIDLIYGAVGEPVDAWKRTIDETIALEPAHVSAYGLTVEPGTPLAADPARHPDDDDQADKYEMATDRLAAAGYEWYEISNWAKPGNRCRHNLLYWSEGEYLGVGCAAHGHRGGRRAWNIHTPDRYVTAIEAGRSPEAGHEELNPTERRREALQLGIRTASGVPAHEVPAALLEDLVGFIEPIDDRVVLTRRGRLVANEVAIRLG